MSRTTFKLISAIAVLTSSSAYAAEQVEQDYIAGGHYTATFHQHAGNWQYTPADGQDLNLSSADNCSVASEVPKGVWLLTSDANGDPELQAPSALNLPAGHSGSVQLVACDQAADGITQIVAPQLLLDLLVNSAGAVRIDD